jgi:hypothetical protein
MNKIGWMFSDEVRGCPYDSAICSGQLTDQLSKGHPTSVYRCDTDAILSKSNTFPENFLSQI